MSFTHQVGTRVEKTYAVDCSDIPPNCRTTIDQLTDATTSEDTDEFIISRGGETFKVSTYEIISKLLDDTRLAAKIEEIVQSSNTNTDTSNTTQTASIGGLIDTELHQAAQQLSTTYQFPDFDPDNQVVFYQSADKNNALRMLIPGGSGVSLGNDNASQGFTISLSGEGLVSVGAIRAFELSGFIALFRFTKASDN
ncbi:MAG: hypothetical protein CBC05_08955 [Crocinitomicaceae bacterium TMED45]|nr:MAG: hypothetical protein CBC05_08955 [Crocinitomicaceae bacterium TMED45]